MNYILEYYNQIKDGKIIACRKIHQVMEMLKDILDKELDKDSKWYFNEDEANRPIEFIEMFCKHSKGKWAGKPVILELWQKAIIQATYGILDKKTNLRRFQEVLIVIARKNGKTTLAAALALYEFIASGEGGAQVFCTANKLDQAKLLYNEAKNMVNQSSVISKLVKRTRTTLETKEATQLYNTLSPLASDSNTLDGLNPSMAIQDEIHAAKTDELYSVIKQGMSARDEPLLFQITTNGFVREGLFDNQYNYACDVLNGIIQAEIFLPFIYEQDTKDEIEKEETWIKSNPNLGISKSYKYIRDMIISAKSKPSEWTTLYTKDFNLPQKTSEGWLSLDFLNFKETYEVKSLEGNYAIGGVDLSNTMDLTSACLIIESPDEKGKLKVISHFFMPQERLQDKVTLDKVPYDLWADKGWITLTKGNIVDLSDVTNWFKKMYEQYNIIPYWIGYDRWCSSYWVDDMKKQGFTKLQSVIQGPKTFSPAMDLTEALLEANQINYNSNPVLRWCLTNVIVKKDEGGNKGPDKKHSTGRIDGAVALLDAMVIYLNNKQEYQNLQGI